MMTALVTFGLGTTGVLAADTPTTHPSALMPIEPTRVLDTRINAGLDNAFTSGQARQLKVTGTIPTVNPNNTITTKSPIPNSATTIVANLTAVAPTTIGFVSARPGDATGTPSTSSLNFTVPGGITANSITVPLATDGTINLYFSGTKPNATVDLLIDIVGYYTTTGTVGPPSSTSPPDSTSPNDQPAAGGYR